MIHLWQAINVLNYLCNNLAHLLFNMPRVFECKQKSDDDREKEVEI